MDFLGIFVDGNMLQTFCNMFLVVFALDFISNLAQILRMKQGVYYDRFLLFDGQSICFSGVYFRESECSYSLWFMLLYYRVYFIYIYDV